MYYFQYISLCCKYAWSSIVNCYGYHVGFALQEPVWHMLGPHIGIISGTSTLTNIEDGFYYISFLKSLSKLLENEQVYNQVGSS